MISIELKRRSDGAVVVEHRSQLRVPDSMVSSRRRMRVFTKRLRVGLELKFPGITFKQFEVVFTKHNARLSCILDADGMRILKQHFNPTE